MSIKFTRRQASALLLGGTVAAALAPVQPARAANSGLIFVSHEKTHDIWVLKPGTLEIVKKIKTSRRPRDIHFNKARTLLYAACGDDDVIDIIDIAKLAVVDQIPTSPSPEAFRLNSTETQIYVSNEEDSSLSIIDLKEKIIIHDVPTGAEPEGVILSPDEKTIYVTSEVADMVHVVDVKGGFVTDNIVVGTRPRRFWLTPDGKELWVTCELSGEIYVIDRVTLKILQVMTFLPPGFRQVDVTPVGILMNQDGSKCVIALGRANHIAYVDVKSRKIDAYVLVGSRAWNVTLSRDEKTLYVANGLSDDITVVDNIARKSIKSVQVGRIPYAVLIDD
ncbi:MAG: hypothetical protein EXQ88_01720 [Alphaproteobacteria bacterium]|nr:hypothetical protein [Alphaproteobacteria bacterium]